MAQRTMLTPNPGRGGKIARVIVLQDDPEGPYVLDVGAIYDAPRVLKSFNPSYPVALQFWKGVAGVVVLAGIVLSFTWHWWAFILGGFLAFLIDRGNKQSAADFAVESIAKSVAAVPFFQGLGLVWQAKPHQIVRDRT